MERNNRAHTTPHSRSFKDETTDQDEYASIEITSIRPARPPRKPLLQARQRRYLWLGLVAIVIIIALVSIPIGIINYRQNLPTLQIAGNPLWTFSDTGLPADALHWNADSTRFSFATSFFAKGQTYNLKTNELIQYPPLNNPMEVGHETQTYSSPNGNYTIFIDSNRNQQQKNYLFIWDTTTGKLLFRYAYHINQKAVAGAENPSPTIWWSTDNTQMATLDNDGSLIIWQVKSGNPPFTLHDLHMPFSYVTWSTNGKEIAVSTEDGYVEIWDLTKKARISIGIASPTISSLTFSPDTQHLAALDSDALSILSTHNGTVTVDNTLYVPITDGPPAIWSADGHYIVITGNEDNKSSAAVWDVSGTKQIMTTRIFKSAYETAIVSPDRRYLATLEADGNTVDVWEISSGRKMATHHDIMIGSNHLLAWSPDGKYLAGTFQNNEVHIWNALTGKDVMFIDKESGIESISPTLIQIMQWSPDSAYIAISVSNDQDLLTNYKYTVAIWKAPHN